MSEVFVSLGSNLDRERNIASAIAVLRDRFGELQLSPVYNSKSAGFEGADFLNMVVSFETEEPPELLQQEFHQIEEQHGRVRSKEPFGPRSLDIDLILYGDLVCQNTVSLPREDILKYAFVLKPLADLVPGYRHPVSGDTYADLWKAFQGDRGLAKANIQSPSMEDTISYF